MFVCPSLYQLLKLREENIKTPFTGTRMFGTMTNFPGPVHYDDPTYRFAREQPVWIARVTDERDQLCAVSDHRDD